MVGINLKNVSTRDIKRGMIISDSESTPHQLTQHFTALIRVVYHPRKIKVGYQPIVFGVVSRTQCKLTQVVKIIDRADKDRVHSPDELFTGDTAVVGFEPQKDVKYEVFEEYGCLGRIVIRDMGYVIAVGKIVEVVPREVGVATSK